MVPLGAMVEEVSTAALANVRTLFRFLGIHFGRMKAAKDTRYERGRQTVTDLLVHENVKATKRHYLRRRRIVPPTR